MFTTFAETHRNLLVECSVVWLFSSCLYIPSPARWRDSSRRWRIVTVLLLLIVVALPARVASTMIRPIEREAARHDSNAYDEWASIGKECENSSFAKALVTYWEWESVPTDEQQVVLKETEPLMIALCDSLQKPIWIPIAYTLEDINMQAAMAFRASSRLVMAHGNSRLKSRSDGGVELILVVAKMGAVLQRGGLKIDSLVGMGINSQAINSFMVHLSSLSPKDRLRIVTDLKRWMDEIESAEVILKRDAAWSISMYWVWHVRAILEQLLGIRGEEIGFESAANRHLAECRMLIIELLLENYREETGRYPENLGSLLPATVIRG